MTFDDISDDAMDEKIKIFATDDQKIKLFGEIFTNDSSRSILQLLFNEELSANQIAQKTDISLQLVKYHLNKLQNLGVVKICKVEKNSKSQDMKIYSATKFSIVIVPPTLSEKTKESKLLVRSFRHIYKVVGLGIATGISALFSSSTLNQSDPVVMSQTVSEASYSIKPLMDSKSDDFADSLSSDLDVSQLESLDRVSLADQPIQDLHIVDYVISDTTITFTIITIILGSFTIYYIWKAFRR